MTDPRQHEDRTAAADLRRERLSHALRENLKRRKAQARGRNERAAGSQDAATDNPAAADDDSGLRSR